MAEWPCHSRHPTFSEPLKQASAGAWNPLHAHRGMEPPRYGRNRALDAPSFPLMCVSCAPQRRFVPLVPFDPGLPRARGMFFGSIPFRGATTATSPGAVTARRGRIDAIHPGRTLRVLRDGVARLLAPLPRRPATAASCRVRRRSRCACGMAAVRARRCVWRCRRRRRVRGCGPRRRTRPCTMGSGAHRRNGVLRNCRQTPRFFACPGLPYFST